MTQREARGHPEWNLGKAALLKESERQRCLGSHLGKEESDRPLLDAGYLYPLTKKILISSL